MAASSGTRRMTAGIGGEAGDLRGAPAALARDDFVALRFTRRGAVDGAHDDRLDDALRLDRGGEFFERFLAHVDARLVLAPLQQVERQIGELVAGQFRRGADAADAPARPAAARPGCVIWPSSASRPRPMTGFFVLMTGDD